ncbi:MAG: fibronectin type III domain-containing protein, partial [candidate division Zixibacteria bacterium]|nr:fibronectin type III domain-containing protein [candidate division Zixibacteria bacterium]
MKTIGLFRFLPALTSFSIAFFIIFSPALKAQAPDDSLSTTSPDALAVSIAPPTSLVVFDYKYDDGEALELTWVPSVDDLPVVGKVTGYELYRSDNGGEFYKITELIPGSNNFRDEDLSTGVNYVYYIVALSADARAASAKTQAIQTHRGWFNFNMKYLFL